VFATQGQDNSSGAVFEFRSAFRTDSANTILKLYEVRTVTTGFGSGFDVNLPIGGGCVPGGFCLALHSVPSAAGNTTNWTTFAEVYETP
jgi:hypothetical protein